MLPVARQAVAIARGIVREHAPRSVGTKGDRDVVTDVDLAVEEAVRSFLARETPEVGFLGEEHGRSGGTADEQPWWVLDPVDGTANLACGIPLCAVSLGLVSGARAALAAIDLPFLGAEYTAVAGKGAFCGGERIHVPGSDAPTDAVVSIGDFAVGEGAAARNRVRLDLLDRLGARVRRVRMLGAAAIDLAWTAHGRLDGTVILANLPWDTAAGVLLVREAGGDVVDRDGSPHSVDSSATIALAPGLRTYLMAEVRRAYGIR
nr:inositol monophosphatase family protein [Nocardiopsis mwathae]